jgi:glyoxylase-like metal-dependent hydrolase (beta-lactamase superfamily II)
MIAYGGRSGFPEDELRAALQNHPGYKYSSTWVPDLSILNDDDRIDVGGYHLQCIMTPGHTRGHTCLYEAANKIFICGDHILNDITPNIQCWTDRDDPLKEYLASLERVYDFEVELALPGHRRLFENYKGRIDELKTHHKNRLDEVLSILGEGPNHAFGVASQMTWDISYDSWEQFPVSQKWFATGEAIAHLRYLEEEGKIVRGSDAEKIQYALNHEAS